MDEERIAINASLDFSDTIHLSGVPRLFSSCFKGIHQRELLRGRVKYENQTSRCVSDFQLFRVYCLKMHRK